FDDIPRPLLNQDGTFTTRPERMRTGVPQFQGAGAGPPRGRARAGRTPTAADLSIGLGALAKARGLSKGPGSQRRRPARRTTCSIVAWAWAAASLTPSDPDESWEARSSSAPFTSPHSLSLGRALAIIRES